jgi:hypothetical protein
MANCCVKGCNEQAVFQVILYDFYPHDGELFSEKDITCPFICTGHAIENEQSAKGERKPRGSVDYQYTNQHGAQGFTIYQPISNLDSGPN